MRLLTLVVFCLVLLQTPTQATADELTRIIQLDLQSLGYDPGNTNALGSSPSALGNRIAGVVLGYFSNDKWDDYTAFMGDEYATVNMPMAVAGIVLDMSSQTDLMWLKTPGNFDSKSIL